MTEEINRNKDYIKVGYYSMGLSSILAGVLLVLNQLGYEIAGGIYILWPTMMILLGLETILSKMIISLSKSKSTLKPAWGILFICTILVGCSQIWLMLLDTRYLVW